MDSNVTLQETVELARSIIAISGDEDALRLANYILWLHDYLMHGGAYPAAWIKHPRENLSRDQGASGL